MIFKNISRVEKKDGLGPPTNVLHLLKEIWLMLKEIHDNKRGGNAGI